MVNRACQTCHPAPEAELKARVETIQDRHHALMTRAGDAAVSMIQAIVEVRKPYSDRDRAAATEQAKQKLSADPAFAQLPAADQEKKLAAEINAALLALWSKEIAANSELQKLQELQRAAQWRLDFVAAENSMGFHAPQEMARILGESIDLSRQAEVLATKMAATAP